MNTVMENLLTRRSIRAFEDREIPGQELDAILKAAQYAPSAMNRQSWQFTVVQNEDSRRRLTLAMQKALNNPNYNFYLPPTLILVSNERQRQRLCGYRLRDGEYVPGCPLSGAGHCVDQPAEGYLRRPGGPGAAG